MNTPFIEVDKAWLASDVRHVCIKNNWYTHGTCQQYENMLNMVDKYYPSDMRIFYVAVHILPGEGLALQHQIAAHAAALGDGGGAGVDDEL